MRAPILLIGAGRMGGALLAGWIKSGLAPIEIVEPKSSAALLKRARAAKIPIHADLSSAPSRVRACVIAIKPQLLRTEAAMLKDIANSGALMVSIAAGTSIRSLTKAWGPKARVVRAMPNTPGSIGRGISALYAPKRIEATERALAQSLLAALGETVWVGREALVDAATAVSGSGPAYVFHLVEALAEAGRAEGLPRDIAERLARATITGAGALLDADPRPAGALRQEVTSPGGTTEAALKVLMAEKGLRALMARAVAAADAAAALDFYKRAFGAEEVMRWVDPESGKISHSEFRLAGQSYYIADSYAEMEDLGVVNPLKLGGVPMTLWLEVDDLEAARDHAVGEGARLVAPVAPLPDGGRRCTVADPAGFLWTLVARTALA